VRPDAPISRPLGVVRCPLCPSMRRVRACWKETAGRAAARAACRRALGTDCAAGPRRRAGKSRVRYTQKELLFIHQWTRGAPSAPRPRRRPRSRLTATPGGHSHGLPAAPTTGASCLSRAARQVHRAAPDAGGAGRGAADVRAPGRADFFISALNTKLWILILIITLVYLATFFVFGGIWWAVYLCAPALTLPFPSRQLRQPACMVRHDSHTQIGLCFHLPVVRRHRASAFICQ